MMSHLYEQCWSALMYDEPEYYDAVIDDLSKHLKDNPKNVAALNNRAIAFWEIGKIDQAEEDFELAAKLTEREPLPFKHWGMLLEKRGLLQEALQKYEAGLRISSSDAPLNRCAAFLLIELNRAKDALEYLSSATRADRKFKNTYLTRAELHEKLGNRFRAKMDRAIAKLL